MQSFFKSRWHIIAIAAIAMAFVPQMAQAAIVVYSVNMSGPAESPSNNSPGIGSGTVTFNDVSNTMAVNVNFSGLNGNTTAAHIHAATTNPFAGTAGVATTTPTFAGFPTGVTSGSYVTSLDMSSAGSYNAAYITANGGTPLSAFATLMAAAAANKAYFNIHTQAFPGGEIRGFLVAVPEPSSMLLTGLVAGAAVLYRRTSRKQKAEKA